MKSEQDFIKSLKPVDCAGEHRWDETSLIIRFLSRNNETELYSFPKQNSAFIFETFHHLIEIVVSSLYLIIKL